MQKRYDQPFALLLVDVEGLKRINQAYGERAGDETLVGVAGAVERSVRTADTAVRMEEDEFCVLLPEPDRRPRAQVAPSAWPTPSSRSRPRRRPRCGSPIGVVACPQHATTADELLELADGALYRAKAAGERWRVGAGARSTATTTE